MTNPDFYVECTLNSAKVSMTYTFFFFTRSIFSPSLDVLIFWAFSASNVLKGVLNLILYKFVESCFKKVVKVISDKCFTTAKHLNIYQK